MGIRQTIVMAAACGLFACDPGGAVRSDDTVTPPDAESPEPGRVPLRRLTRSEYDSTMRALLGVDLGIGTQFPVDDATDGFDTTASGLSVSPLLAEMFEQGGAQAAAAITDRPVQEPLDVRLEAEADAFTLDEGAGRVLDESVLLWSNGALTGHLQAPAAGTYQVSARVWAQPAGDDDAEVRLGLVGGPGDFFEIDETDRFGAAWISVDVDLQKGVNPFEFRFLNDFYDADTGADRNVYVDAFRLEGPTPFTAEVNVAWDRVVTCDPEAAEDPLPCIEDILRDFTPRAWRRPVDDREIDQLLAIAAQVVQAGDPALWGLEFALRAVFASPHFVFLVEPELPADATEPIDVDAHTLAQRMSFFLWGAPPDDTLWSLADSGELLDDEVLRTQVQRMVWEDAKASWLGRDFAAQWLGFRAVYDAQPDFWIYPTFREEMRASLDESMQRQFMDIVRNNPNINDLVLGTQAWMDGYSALLFEVRNISIESGFQRRDVSTYGRRGFVTHPGILMSTSYPTRTSPVRRGVWVLSNLLCDEPPPPPPGVEGFPEADADAATVRERLAAHRTNPSCRGCHESMDNIGLAFEHFDGLGMNRDYDAGEPIDASGELDDQAFYGAEELAHILANDPRLTTCVVEKTFTYAHRRAPTEADEPYLSDLHDAFAQGSFHFEKLLEAVVLSPTFRQVGPTRPDVDDEEGDAPTEDDAADDGGDE